MKSFLKYICLSFLLYNQVFPHVFSSFNSRITSFFKDKTQEEKTIIKSGLLAAGGIATVATFGPLICLKVFAATTGMIQVGNICHKILLSTAGIRETSQELSNRIKEVAEKKQVLFNKQNIDEALEQILQQLSLIEEALQNHQHPHFTKLQEQKLNYLHLMQNLKSKQDLLDKKLAEWGGKEVTEFMVQQEEMDIKQKSKIINKTASPVINFVLQNLPSLFGQNL